MAGNLGETIVMHNRRHLLQLSAATLVAAAAPRTALSQGAWPTAKPIRAIVPFSAGSTIDILGRIMLDPISRQLGQTIVVENRGGAGGSVTCSPALTMKRSAAQWVALPTPAEAARAVPWRAGGSNRGYDRACRFHFHRHLV